MCSNRWSLVAALVLALITPPAIADADTLTLRFSGTAGLSAFGAPSTSEFNGTVTWDPNTGWVPADPGCPDFCLDGSPGAVTATFEIDGASYTNRIDPISRLIIWGFGGLSLDLYFTPVIDFDGGAAPDLRLASLNLFSDPPDSSILVDGELPFDFDFLSHLNDRCMFFSDTEVTGVAADTLSVVPEPVTPTLLVIGLSAMGVSHRRRRISMRPMPNAPPGFR